MIKYNIYVSSTLVNDEAYQKKKKLVDDMFKVIEEKGMESKMYQLKIGQRLLISAQDLDKGGTICYFICTGAKRGYFTQKFNEAYLFCHTHSLEVTYE